MASKGSYRAKCKIYKDTGKRLKNKKRKIAKHLKKHPNDEISQRALSKI